MDFDNNRSPSTLAAGVLTAYLGRHTVRVEDLPDLARKLREALTDDAPSQLKVDALVSQPTEYVRTTNEIPSTAGPNAEAVLVEANLALLPTPAVPIEESVMDDHLVSLEDGKHFRSLRRHLMTKYGMTPDDYREKWNLPPDYPMVAPSYARERSAVAKRIGLGLTEAQTRTDMPKQA